jgi:hypothetical protein
MVGFFPGTIVGAMLGYAARSWLSARRRRAAQLDRIAVAADSDFVPFKHGKSSIDDAAPWVVARMQPGATHRAQPIDLRARVRAPASDPRSEKA